MAKLGRRCDLVIAVDGVEIARLCEDCNARSDEVTWGVTRDGKPLSYRCRECWKIKYAETIARNRAKWKLIDKAARIGLTADEYLEMVGE